MISVQEIAHNHSTASDISGIHTAILYKLPALKVFPSLLLVSQMMKYDTP